MRLAGLIALALGLALALPGASSAVARATAADSLAVSTWVNATVTIETTFGTIVAMLYEEGAPITTSNFINLSSSGFYDGIKFHRIVDDFVIQTGDPNSKDSNPYNDGTGGSSQTIPLETNDTLTHEDGAFGMARSNDPNSASSQFYICDGAQNGLDGNYAVFGITVEGIDVVRTIASQPVYGLRRPLLQEHPVDDIVMTSVTVSLGFWNNTTAPGGDSGGLGGIFAGPGGTTLLGLILILAVAVAAYLFVPPVRLKLQALLRRIPKASALTGLVRKVLPRRQPR
ncbi:MAG TPA: peptidylprolyl isomerase [Candidatus Thermoplasmatota archaeon]|nr:peptidylprolyl isomerase [Candidatus Thermoplasmatota archaeon]